MQARFALGSVGMRGRRDAALRGPITTERAQMPHRPGQPASVRLAGMTKSPAAAALDSILAGVLDQI